MQEVYVDIKDFADGLLKEDLLRIIAAWYLENEYGEDVSDRDPELEDMSKYIDTHGDLNIAISNTLANVDRDYGEDEDEEVDEDYDYDEEDETYECNCGQCEECTQRLIEANRARNEEALGL